MKRTVFVTGGSRGIGEAIVRRYQSAGWAVIAPERRDLDLSDLDSIASYLNRGGGVDADALVNNAAENRIREIGDLTLEDWQIMLTVNLTAPFLLIRHFAPRMAARGWGRIVNISSCYSIVSRPGRAGYTATKSGLNGLTRTAALEFSGAGVLVNAVCPGFIETDMTRKNNTPKQLADMSRALPIQRMGTGEEVAAYVYSLGSEENTYISGQAAVIDGAFLAR